MSGQANRAVHRVRELAESRIAEARRKRLWEGQRADRTLKIGARDAGEDALRELGKAEGALAAWHEVLRELGPYLTGEVNHGS